MGYHKHHAIIVTSWHDESILAAYTRALRLFPAQLVSSISETGTNNHRSFVVFPDGSKEGWEASRAQDARRSDFIRWLSTTREVYCEWIEVSFDENGDKKVEQHSDEELLVALDAIAAGLDPDGKHRKKLELRLGLRNVTVK